MTLGEYKRATLLDNGYVISVTKQKTAHKGPANIAYSRSLFREIGIYVKYLRNQTEGISTDQDDTVFVPCSGGAVHFSLILTQISSFWKYTLKIDTTGPSKINPMLFRKYTTSTVHEHVMQYMISRRNQ